MNKYSHASHVRTVPFTNCRHIGHFLMAGAQSVQQQRWPQGNMAIEASFSIQILQIIRSFSCLFSSSRDWVLSEKINDNVIKLKYQIVMFFSSSIETLCFICITVVTILKQQLKYSLYIYLQYFVCLFGVFSSPSII